MKIKYDVKASILGEVTLLRYVNAYNRAVFAEHALMVDGEVIFCETDKTADELWSFIFQNWSKSQIDNAQRILRAYYKRVSRLRVRIRSILQSSKPHFLTLTFTDKILESTSADSRRQYVRRFLSQISSNFVANIDFGAQNGREHYHVVIDCLPPAWSYGFYHYEPVICQNTTNYVKKRYQSLPQEEIDRLMALENEKRLSKYVAKLTNHAIKQTTKGCRAIYSRSKSEYIPVPEPQGFAHFSKRTNRWVVGVPLSDADLERAVAERLSVIGPQTDIQQLQ